ncbi:hypothetical protein NDU88_002808 [Pleurodeles waltl]|uniref:Uncharacterized protein n=1 Tax=Pleurodeles waltl TaxID=8319 RepID=A0AAV7TMT9_PLEWA|nr:hypothetical protein NDU88_002808 [Pleurodeles waltl]
MNVRVLHLRRSRREAARDALRDDRGHEYGGVEQGRELLRSEGCWWEMPGDRKDEICQKALQLLGNLCASGTLENENCLDFIYYMRERDRPRPVDSGK